MNQTNTTSRSSTTPTSQTTILGKSSMDNRAVELSKEETEDESDMDEDEGA